MRKMKKVLSLVLSLVLVCGIVAGFAACSGNKENNKKEDTTAQSDLAKIQAAGVLKVGITEYEPMNYKDQKGEWTGYDTEIAQALGPVLQSRGLLLAGVDVIGKCVTEINVTSPTCFQEIFDQTGCDVARLFVDALEAVVCSRT